jgi:hypothetical protein
MFHASRLVQDRVLCVTKKQEWEDTKRVYIREMKLFVSQQCCLYGVESRVGGVW